MDNGVVPSDLQTSAGTAPVSPAVTGPGEPGTPAETPSAATDLKSRVTDAADKVRDHIHANPLFSVALAVIAGFGAARMMKRRPRRPLSL